jgi:hypothetical protein
MGGGQRLNATRKNKDVRSCTLIWGGLWTNLQKELSDALRIGAPQKARFYLAKGTLSGI